MITNLKGLIEAIAASKPQLYEDFASATQYIYGNDYHFGPNDFPKIIVKKYKKQTTKRAKNSNKCPAWFVNNLLQIIEAFAQKQSYGSVIGVFKYLCQNHQDHAIVTTIIEKIKADRLLQEPQLSMTAYNYMYLAAIYVNLVDLWQFLILECGVDINYQTNGFKMFAYAYSVGFASHAGLMSFLKFAQNQANFNPNLQNMLGESALSLAARRMYFNARVLREEKLTEIACMLELGTSVFTVGTHFDKSTPLEDMWQLTADSGAVQLLLQYGAGLVKEEYRRIRYNFSFQQAAKMPGFAFLPYHQADVVLIAQNKENNKLVWLYGVEEIISALRNPNLIIYKEAIAQQLQTADCKILGSQKLFELFNNLPNVETKPQSFLPYFSARQAACSLALLGASIAAGVAISNKLNYNGPS